jgi:hypothetical protein
MRITPRIGQTQIALIIMLMIGFLTSCTKKNDKLSGFYLEAKESIDLSISKTYTYHYFRNQNHAERFRLDVRNDTFRNVGSQKLLMALKKDILEFLKYRRSIDDVEAKISDANEINIWIGRRYRDFKDDQIKRLTTYETPGDHLGESISSFKKKWDRDIDYLNNENDLSLARLNLSKLKLDLLLMIMDAKEVYLINWGVDDRLFDKNPQITIIDDNKVQKNSKYKAKILFGVIDTINVEEVLITDFRINDKLLNFKKNFNVDRIPEFEIDAKVAGKYKYKGYLKYKSAKGNKYIPFEKSFVVE